MFVSAAENGWLAFLGPNKEKIVEWRNREGIPPNWLIGLYLHWSMYCSEKNTNYVINTARKNIESTNQALALGWFLGRDF